MVQWYKRMCLKEDPGRQSVTNKKPQPLKSRGSRKGKARKQENKAVMIVPHTVGSGLAKALR